MEARVLNGARRRPASSGAALQLCVAPSTPAPPATVTPAMSVASATSAMPPADWAALFSAVTERLRDLVGQVDVEGDGDGERLARLRDCVAALQQLRRQLEPGLQGHESLQHELELAQGQLARTRAELVQSRIDRREALHSAWHDPLTQLPNRSHFQSQLESKISGQEGRVPSLAVLSIDLNGFKRINEEHGHPTGDATLCIVARRLARVLRAQDSVCRLGDDEFACLVVAPPGRDQLGQLAGKVYNAVSAPLRVRELTLGVQPSIGIAVYPSDADSGGLLLERADAAMLSAKRQAQGYAFFEARSDQ